MTDILFHTLAARESGWYRTQRANHERPIEARQAVPARTTRTMAQTGRKGIEMIVIFWLLLLKLLFLVLMNM